MERSGQARRSGWQLPIPRTWRRSEVSNVWVFFQTGWWCRQKVSDLSDLGMHVHPNLKCMASYAISEKNTTPRDEHLKNAHKLERKRFLFIMNRWSET
jgi:hypothetical protein